MFSPVAGALEVGGKGNKLLGKLGTGKGSCCGKLLCSSKSTTFVTSAFSLFVLLRLLGFSRHFLDHYLRPSRELLDLFWIFDTNLKTL